MNVDVVLSRLLGMLEPYNAGVVVGGGFALLVYREYFVPKDASPRPAATNDIDFLIPRKFKIREGSETDVPSLATLLESEGFEWRSKSGEIPPVEAYSKKIEGHLLELEFLTDRKSRDGGDSNVAISGIHAQPLSYIEMSLGHATVFHTKGGASGLVVLPGAWIFHKALTFVKRRSGGKVAKDLYGIWYAATQLGSFSDEAVNDFASLTKEHSTWAVRARNQLKDWVAQATPEDWTRLEAQDPSGTLTRARFRTMLERLGVST